MQQLKGNTEAMTMRIVAIESENFALKNQLGNLQAANGMLRTKLSTSDGSGLYARRPGAGAGTYAGGSALLNSLRDGGGVGGGGGKAAM